MNGFEATQAIRQDPALKDLCVIAVTASVLEDHEEILRRSGCNDFLGKPFRAADLFQKLEEHLQWQFVKRPKTRPMSKPALRPRNAQFLAKRIREHLALGDISAIIEIANELKKMPGGETWANKIAQYTQDFSFE